MLPICSNQATASSIPPRSFPKNSFICNKNSFTKDKSATKTYLGNDTASPQLLCNILKRSSNKVIQCFPNTQKCLEDKYTLLAKKSTERYKNVKRTTIHTWQKASLQKQETFPIWQTSRLRFLLLLEPPFLFQSTLVSPSLLHQVAPEIYRFYIFISTIVQSISGRQIIYQQDWLKQRPSLFDGSLKSLHARDDLFSHVKELLRILWDQWSHQVGVFKQVRNQAEVLLFPARMVYQNLSSILSSMVDWKLTPIFKIILTHNFPILLPRKFIKDLKSDQIKICSRCKLSLLTAITDSISEFDIFHRRALSPTPF